MNEVDSISLISNLILRLYENIHIGERPENFFYAKGDYYLGGMGDNNGYYEIFHVVFKIPRISDTWSEQAVKEEIHQLLDQLAKIKKTTMITVHH